MRWKGLGISLLLMLALGIPASANMGTPLMWLGFFQLAFGNAIIGAIEALTLRFAFGLPYRRGLVFMTFANYASLVIGWAILQGVEIPFRRLFPSVEVLQMLPRVITALWMVLFVWTVFAEAPFVHQLFSRESHSWRVTLQASFLAQTVSSLLLVPLYLSVSNYSFVTQTHIERDLHFVQPPLAQVYYIGLDGNLWRINTDGTGRQKWKELRCKPHSARLYAKQDATTKRWDLWCADYEQDLEEKVVEGISGRRMPVYPWAKERYLSEPRDFGYALDYRPPQQRRWTAIAGFWAVQGLRVSYLGQEAYVLGMETPFLTWFTRRVTCLPGDYAVFQLGDYILILHLPTRKLGFLAAGRSPLVVMPDRDAPEEKEQATASRRFSHVPRKSPKRG